MNELTEVFLDDLASRMGNIPERYLALYGIAGLLDEFCNWLEERGEGQNIESEEQDGKAV